MSNLGWYQVLTTVAKKVGGPLQLAGMLIGGGAILGGGAVAGGNALRKKIVSELNEKNKIAEAAIVYTVNTEGKSNEGLLFRIGDRFKVLESDRDVGLIEIIDDDNSPYYVSLKFLSTISDFKLTK